MGAKKLVGINFLMASSIFSTFWFLLISAGSKWGNMAVAVAAAAAAIEDPPMALLPFGSAFRGGSFAPCGRAPPPSDEAATITVKNNCLSTIWPATLTSSPGQHQLSTTGFELAAGASASINIVTPWTGRVWARTQCSINGDLFSCLTGDCGRGLQCNGAGGVSPATLTEFSLAAPNRSQDFYDVSLVDGFNIQASITTQDGTGPCKSSNCLVDMNRACPAELQLKSGNQVIGCKSACFAFNEPRYCCTGDFNDPNKCKSTNYSEIFKNLCPNAYSYAYDDTNSAFICSNRPNYVITFCS